MSDNRQKVAVAALSVISNSALVVLKLVVGLVIGSISVISEAIHSGMDLLASVIALYAVRTSDKPADAEHPWGHGKVENLSGVVEAILIFIAAVWIISEAIRKLLRAEPLDEPSLGILIMLISSVANLIVSRMLFRVARKTHSVALEADAWHLRTDVYTSAGVMVGLGLIWFGERAFPGLHFHWIDPLAAMIVAAMIIKAAWDLTVKSTHDLLDVRLPVQELEWIHACLEARKPQVHGFHKLRTRRSGPNRFVEFHMLVDGSLTVEAAHTTSEEVASAIREKLPLTAVTIHIEPQNDPGE